MIRFTTTLDPELYSLLQSRSNYNRRSMNKEIVFLLETALAAEIDGNLSILRTLMVAQGGVSSIPHPVAEST
ncbi:hypothetical protein [Mesorhizobium sp. STM 4661]|uniref:hypothetical protein n=1 Tax=Mesorhizobium sp. STM 4661 TaxID=1297570 RepID=UPI0002BFBE2C|nr:hypothetical protein [Mesorhizobium sp. STM 4661]CCV12936.1 hypothetical protein MESS4_510103 [Mesorhizobium sp. STM 4661]